MCHREHITPWVDASNLALRSPGRETPPFGGLEPRAADKACALVLAARGRASAADAPSAQLRSDIAHLVFVFACLALMALREVSDALPIEGEDPVDHEHKRQEARR